MGRERAGLQPSEILLHGYLGLVPQAGMSSRLQRLPCRLFDQLPPWSAALEQFSCCCGSEDLSECHFYWRKMAVAFVAVHTPTVEML